MHATSLQPHSTLHWGTPLDAPLHTGLRSDACCRAMPARQEEEEAIEATVVAAPVGGEDEEEAPKNKIDRILLRPKSSHASDADTAEAAGRLRPS